MMWTSIFLENQEALLTELRRAAEEMATLRELLTNQDEEGLVDWLEEAKRLRDGVSHRS